MESGHLLKEEIKIGKKLTVLSLVVLAALVLVFSGWLKSLPGMDLRMAITLLGLLFVPGILIVCFMPETKDQPLPSMPPTFNLPPVPLTLPMSALTAISTLTTPMARPPDQSINL
jgi:hypothetical protein